MQRRANTDGLWRLPAPLTAPWRAVHFRRPQRRCAVIVQQLVVLTGQPLPAMQYCYLPEAVDDVEHDIDIETGPIHNWSSLLYEVWRLAFGMEIHRVVWQLDDFFADVDGPEERRGWADG